MRLILIFRHKKAPGAACQQVASFPENLSRQQISLFEIYITLTFMKVQASLKANWYGDRTSG
ncbi:hypothetical protein DRT82_27095 [Salmonella enterica subsp. diarizonae]|nr:hypothetical protein [Salmonella enterica]EBV2375224.1 hypothetical protein [Salmonella enterica subsp. enterica serovar Enteritidis]ECI2947110.1 hypothetical protein [Salmonella enterica subsp. diarizonae]ECI3372817.1 hypothetical protein [Salmonella enterica subsp. diarizonae]ECI4846454.1 hypothetical protein [Salmonella enterica subsp. diarizonae]